MQQYENVMNRANAVASQPLQQYGGGLLAGFNPEQQGAFGAVNTYAGAAQPWLQTAGGMTTDASQAIWPNVQQFSGANVQKYMSPYVQNVVDTTMKEIQNQNAIQGQALLGQGIAAGNAFGGDRAGIAAAQLANQQAMAQNQTIAGLYNQGYGQALGEFNQQQMAQFQGLSADAQRQMAGAQQLAGLGQASQQLGLAGAQAQLGVGGMQQQLQQEQLNIPYQMYLQQLGYPFQTTQWLGGLAEGIGGMMGGTSQTGYPQPSMISQAAGLGTAALGAASLIGALERGGRVDGYDAGGPVIDGEFTRVPEDDGLAGYAGGGGIDNSRGLGASASYDISDPMGRKSGYYEDLASMVRQYGLSSPMGQYAQRMLIARQTSPEMNTGAAWQGQPPMDPSSWSPQGLSGAQGQGMDRGGVPHLQGGGPGYPSVNQAAAEEALTNASNTDTGPFDPAAIALTLNPTLRRKLPEPAITQA